jgi:hypothetical protein
VARTLDFVLRQRQWMLRHDRWNGDQDMPLLAVSAAWGNGRAGDWSI